MADEKKVDKVADSKVTQDNRAIMDDVVKLTLLDGKEYTFSSLPFTVAKDLVKNLNLVNIMAPVMNLVDEKNTENLLKVLAVIFSQHHPEVTKERLSKEKIVSLRQIHKIIHIALDINEIKK